MNNANRQALQRLSAKRKVLVQHGRTGFSHPHTNNRGQQARLLSPINKGDMWQAALGTCGLSGQQLSEEASRRPQNAVSRLPAPAAQALLPHLFAWSGPQGFSSSSTAAEVTDRFGCKGTVLLTGKSSIALRQQLCVQLSCARFNAACAQLDCRCHIFAGSCVVPCIGEARCPSGTGVSGSNGSAGSGARAAPDRAQLQGTSAAL